MNLEGLENTNEWIVVAAIFCFIALLLVLLVFAKGRGSGGRSDARGWVGNVDKRSTVQVTCPVCKGALKVKRDLPMMHRNAVGVSDMERCPSCKGKGWILE